MDVLNRRALILVNDDMRKESQHIHRVCKEVEEVCQFNLKRKKTVTH